LVAGRTSVAVTTAPSRRADAHHEYFCGGNGTRRGHHHREGAAEGFGGFDHRAVAGKIGLRRQHVHHLRAGDARHQFHGERGDTGARNRLQRRLVAVRVHDGDHQRAALVFREFRRLRPLHLDNDVGVLERIRADGGASRGELGIGQARLDARARFDHHIGADRLELLHGVGGSGDPRFGRVDFLGNGNLHEASGGAGSARVSKLALFPLSWIPVLQPDDAQISISSPPQGAARQMHQVRK
jgi:hypothetical protein